MLATLIRWLTHYDRHSEELAREKFDFLKAHGFLEDHAVSLHDGWTATPAGLVKASCTLCRGPSTYQAPSRANRGGHRCADCGAFHRHGPQTIPASEEGSR